MSRRALLRAAAGVGLAGALAGCGSQAARLVRAAAAPVVLLWRPWYSFPRGSAPSTLAVMREAIAPWLAANPGVEVRLTTLGYQEATVAAILAGTGPDVFEDGVLPTYVQSGLLLDLSPYVARDGVDLGLFARQAVDYLEQTGRFAPGGPGLFGLPAYTHTLALALNQGIVDALGVPYPEPDWTYRDWTRLWESATRRSGDPARQRFGGQLYWTGYDFTMGNPAPFYLRGFGGEYVDAADSTRCVLDAPGSVACLSWAYSLLHEGVVGGDGRADFTDGRQMTALVDTAGVLPYAAAAWRGVKWDLYPMPVWPRGRFTFGSSDFYAVSAATAQPEVAWEFVKFLCVGTTWQRFMARLAMIGPNQPRLFPEWLEVVRATAPPLRDKDLGVLARAVERGEPYIGASFRYQEVASGRVIARYGRLAQAGQLSVLDAARRATAEVDALQAGGAQAQAEQLREVEAVERIALAPGPVRLGPPPVDGAGQPPAPLPLALAVRERRGAYTILGGGASLGGTVDDCTLFAAADTSSRATYVCRLRGLANVNCPSLSPRCTVGVMVRADLSDDAPMFAVGLTAGNGLWSGARLAADTPVRGFGPAATAEPVGLIGAPFLTRPLDVWVPNYLLQPVWLKVERDGVSWTAYSSWDGRQWYQAGPRQVVEMAAAWVGLFACAHNADFGSRFYVRATFDHLNWRPRAAFAVGSRGAVPDAGPVPPAWAQD